MNKTKIEWCDYTWNPVKGLCPVGCEYCYAHKIYKRFKWNPKIRFDEKELKALSQLKRPSKVFVGSMIDLFYDSMPSEWISLIIAQIMKYPQHCFLFLTKFPKRYTSFKFPSNCLLGATITCQRDLWRIDLIREIGGFLSCEPLLEDLSDLDFHGIEWIIIGGLTPRPVHNKEWVDKIVEQADFCKIPVFIKDNALYLPVKREFPENEVKPCWCLHYQDVIDNKQAIK